MDLADALRVIEDADPEARVEFRAGRLRELMAAHARAARRQLVGTTRAAEIMGETPRSVRRLAARWAREIERGKTPEVYVTRRSDAPEAHWLFDEKDCWEYRRQRGAVRIEPEAEDAPDPNDADRIAVRMLVSAGYSRADLS